MKLGEFNFLLSKRFWALVIGALSIWLSTDGYISAAFATFLVTIAGGFISIRTIDRFSETIKKQ